MTSIFVVDSRDQEDHETMTSRQRRPLGLAEIADLLRVGEATPTRWKYRKAVTGFPDPDGYTSRTVPYWWDTTIEKWAKATNRWPMSEEERAATTAEETRRQAQREAEERAREAETARQRALAAQAQAEAAERAAEEARQRAAGLVAA